MLTDSQRLILLSLRVAADGRVLQKALKPAVARADREALVAAGLLTAAKQNRAVWLEITAKGAAVAEAELGGTLPESAQALQSWLGRLKAYLTASGLSLADILAPKVAPKPDVRQAYLSLTGGALNQRVRLKDLRAQLGGGVALDAALEAAHGREGIFLSSSDNPPELTAEDRAAALVYKGEPMHFVWITQ